MNTQQDKNDIILIGEEYNEPILNLYQTYNYLNLTFEKFEKLCKNIILNINLENENISYKKTIEILQISLDKYVQKKLKDEKNSNKIINNFINNNIKIKEELRDNIEELRKINNFLIRYEVEETPELYSELLTNQIIDSIVASIVKLKQDKKHNQTLTTINGNHNIQLLLEIYCENHQISFTNTYNEIIDKEYDKDMELKTIDGFGLYLSQIAKPLLTKEEEQRLFILKEQGDKKATEQLIEHNLQLVVHIAKSYTGKGLDILDLVQEGNLGLMSAIEKFDYRKGYKLSTYATWWIRQSIQRGLMNSVRTIRIPVHLQEKIHKYNMAYSKLMAELKRIPTRTEICKELNITPAQLSELEIANQDIVSMNAIVGNKDESDSELEDFLISEDESPEDEIFRNCMSEEIKQVIMQTNLTERERLVIIERFGLSGKKPKTLSEIANMFKLTRERIRQIEAKALRKIRLSPYIKNLASIAGMQEQSHRMSNKYQNIVTYDKRKIYKLNH